MRNRNRIVLAVCTGAALVAAAWLGWPRTEAPQPAAGAGAPSALVPMSATRKALPASSATVVFSEQDRDFIRDLRERFAPHLQSKHSQIRLIEQLIAYLMQQYPDDWQARVHAFLRELFPAIADALYDRFERLMRYNDWLRVNRDRLLAMAPAERREALWAARAEAFGADAGEIFAAQRRGERVSDALASLETLQGFPVQQKLDVFLEAIDAAYGEAAPALLESRGTELMNGFLAVDAVQDDLRALGAAERQEALREIRRRMGLDAAALARWDQLDQARDAAWENGQAYMAERERIQREYEGAEEADQLQALQDRHFGDDAETIRSEEAAGFYRYGDRRRFGRE